MHLKIEIVPGYFAANTGNDDGDNTCGLTEH